MSDEPTTVSSNEAPSSLGLGLQFVDGRARLAGQDLRVAEGVVLRALELVVPDVEFPLDLAGGADQFKQRYTQLERLSLDLSLDVVSARLREALVALDAPVQQLTIKPDRGALAVETELVSASGTSFVTATMVLAPTDGRALRVVLSDVRMFGHAHVAPDVLIDALRDAANEILSNFVGESEARRVGFSSLELDPVPKILWSLFPGAGWKLPDHRDVVVLGAFVTKVGDVRVVCGHEGDAREEDQAAEDPAGIDRVLRVLAKEDAGDLTARADAWLDQRNYAAAFEELRSRLDASGGPQVLVERLLALGAGTPHLLADCADLAKDELVSHPNSVAALLAFARVAEQEDRGREASEAYERAAIELQSLGELRSASFSLLAAARAAPSAAHDRRAELVDRACEMLPDHPAVLAELVSVLPEVDRVSQAVRAARRWAKVARSDQERVRAHVRAAELLRDRVKDVAQAKREFERALRIDSKDPAAMEGLARSLVEQGDPRRASAMLERLIKKAESEEKDALAARLSVALGDVWRALDAEAALARYRRAQSLAPRDPTAASRIADVAVESGRYEEAIDALDTTLVLTKQSLSEARSTSAGQQDVPELQRRVRDLHLRIAQVFHKRLKRPAEAAPAFEAALQLDPSSKEALEALIEIYGALDKRDRRADLVNRFARVLAAGQEVGKAAELWVEKARLDKAEGRSLDDVENMLRTVGRRTSAPLVMDARVRVAELSGDLEKVVEALVAQIRAEPDARRRAAMNLKLGQLYASRDMLREARAAFEAVLDAAPDDIEALRALGTLAKTRADRARVEALYEAAFRSAGDSARVPLMVSHAEVLLASNRVSDASAQVERALSRSPDDDAALRLATELAFRQADFARALELADRRIRDERPLASEAQVSAQIARAKALAGLGDVDTALDVLDPLISVLLRAESPLVQSAFQAVTELLRPTSRRAELAWHLRRHAENSNDRSEVADLYLESAGVWQSLGDAEQAKSDLERALSAAEGTESTRRRDDVLNAWERMARDSSDPQLSADLQRARAETAEQKGERIEARLEEAQILESTGQVETALARLSEAQKDAPESLEVNRRMGELARRAGRLHTAAKSFAAAARLADKRGDTALAVELHASAAATFWQIDEPAFGVVHDTAVIDGAEPNDATTKVVAALKRLERFARDEDDVHILVRVLDRWANIESDSMAAQLLVEKADLESRQLVDPAGAARSLRRALSLAQAGSELARLIEGRLTEMLEKTGEHEAQLGLLEDRARHTKDVRLESRLRLKSARIAHDHLGDPEAALRHLRAALAADPENSEALQLQLEWLRREGPSSELEDALAQQLERSNDKDERARLALEAAEQLAPLDKLASGRTAMFKTDTMKRAFSLAQEAARALKRSESANFRLAVYARQLNLSDDEFLALGNVLEASEDPNVQVACLMRRVDLLRGPLGDNMAAQAELQEAIRRMEELPSASKATLDTLERFGCALDGDPSPLSHAIRIGLILTESNEDWKTHLVYLDRFLAQINQLSARAAVHVRAGEVWEWKIGDGDEAERQYLAALALDPKQEGAKKALRSLYMAVDRFVDLANNLGLDALLAAWHEVQGGASTRRVIAAAEALWPRLEEGSEERGLVLMQLADLYRSVRDEPQGARLLLEQVLEQGPRSMEDAARARLRTLYLEEGDFLQYVDVLRRQVEKTDDDVERAQVLAELGEALEWKLGDGAGAEREYRAALAADPNCQAARDRFGTLLSSQDRFDELAAELGVEALRREVNVLLGREFEARRALDGLEALARQLPEGERARMWLRASERFTDPDSASAAYERARGQSNFDEAVRLFSDTGRIATDGAAPSVTPGPGDESEHETEIGASLREPGNPTEIGPSLEDRERVAATHIEPSPPTRPSQVIDLAEARQKREEEAAHGEPADADADTKRHRPSDARPADATSAEATPADATPADATPADATPADATPADATPVDATPVDAETVESPESVESESSESVESASSESVGSEPESEPVSGAPESSEPVQASEPVESESPEGVRAAPSEAAAESADGPSSLAPRRPSFDLLEGARAAAEAAPHDLEKVEALLHALGTEAPDDQREGPERVRAFLAGETVPPFIHLEAPISLALLHGHLFTEQTRAPLARLLHHTATSVAAILPPLSFPFAQRVLADAPEMARLLELTEALTELRMVVQVQRAQPRASIEPGEPPVLVIDEALASSAATAEARFIVGRAAMLLRLGYLLVIGENAPDQVSDWIRLLLRVTDERAETKVPETMRAAIGPLRNRLGPSGLAVLSTISEKIRSVPDDGELELWAKGAIRVAHRFGLILSGDLSTTIRILLREMGEDPELAPEEAASDVQEVSDLLQFLLSSDFVALLAAARSVGDEPL